MNNDPGLVGTLLVSLSAAMAWLGGETGKIIVAGGLGGLVRWLATEGRRRVRDGILAVVCGCVTGTYMWPLALHLPVLFGREPFPETANTIPLAVFITGTLGTSAVKIITTYIEVRADRLTIGGRDEGQNGEG